MIANTLPLLTWRWLKVNESLIDLPEVENKVTEIVAKEGDEVSTLFDISDLNGCSEARHNIVNIKAEKDSKVNVYYVSRCEIEEKALTEFNVEVMEDAEVNFIQVEAGGKQSVTNFIADLVGRKASVNIETVYFVDEEKSLDLFYNINHIGKETNSNILVNGALKDKSKKTFKGTIDFKRGSIGSKGSEEEFATLLDEDVRSIAVPVLLCQEDNVEGVHAASAGKIDQDKLFYIMSRGLDLDSAKKIMVETKLNPTIQKLPGNELSRVIWEQIEKKI